MVVVVVVVVVVGGGGGVGGVGGEGGVGGVGVAVARNVCVRVISLKSVATRGCLCAAVAVRGWLLQKEGSSSIRPVKAAGVVAEWKSSGHKSFRGNRNGNGTGVLRS